MKRYENNQDNQIVTVVTAINEWINLTHENAFADYNPVDHIPTTSDVADGIVDPLDSNIVWLDGEPVSLEDIERAHSEYDYYRGLDDHG